MAPADPEKKPNDVTVSSSSERPVYKNIFSIPGPIKRLFDSVPVLTYPPNELPQRCPRDGGVPTLYIFSREEDVAQGKPSFNPSCLKWQTFLKIAGIDHQLVFSNNHASPTGVLPFLLPAISKQDSEQPRCPIPSNKFIKYAREHGSRISEVESLRLEAYQSLLDLRVRNAWLYALYLEESNFKAVAYPLYISATSSNTLVRATTSHQLRAAAEAELLKYSAVIDIDDLYNEADKSFEALSVLLGHDSWFFGSGNPSLFDASVFAYTHLLLDDSLEWKERKLCRALERRENLVRHRERLFERYYGG